MKALIYIPLIAIILTIILLIILTKNKESYNTCEHRSIGNSLTKTINSNTTNVFSPIKLKFKDKNIKGYIEIDTANTVIPLTNGINVKFGDIISLAGDFYGTPESPISEGITNSERKKLFMKAFNLLDKKDVKDNYGNFLTERDRLFDVINNECKVIQENLNRNKNGSDGYNQLYGTSKATILYENMKYVEATGGLNPCKNIDPVNNPNRYLLCTVGNVNKDLDGRYLKLAKNNPDHFTSDGALITYKTGHTLALEEAIKARKCGENIVCVNNILRNAYKLEAFAFHFLTDMFATGHMRTQRTALKNGPDNFTGWTEFIGALLSGKCHDYDNKNGLFIKTKGCSSNNPKVVRDSCKTFKKVYGDGKLLDKDSGLQEYRNHIISVLQKSVNEIWTAYKTGIIPRTFSVENHLPNTDFMGSEYKSNNPTTFTLQGGTIFGNCIIEPEKCERELGPEWKQESYSDCKRVCVRDRINDSQLYLYNPENDIVYYKREDGDSSLIYGEYPKNSMDEMDSSVLSFIVDE